MRLLFVVQRYGAEVAGGSEAFCRAFATRLAARGHEVDVVTSCAVSYRDWADHYPAGTEVVDGVTVHRLPVTRPRDDRFFDPLNARVVWGGRPVPLHLQVEWMRMQGPLVEGLPGWLRDRAAGYDCCSFFTYLYWTTWAGLGAAAPYVPTVLHPTAHDEPPMYLPIFDFVFSVPAGFGYLTEEEEDLVRRRFRVRAPSVVTGVGVDLDAAGDPDAFRRRFDLGDDPYLLYLGRIDPSKGSDELVDFFAAVKRRNPSPLKLVVVGERSRPPGSHVDVIVTDFVDEATKQGALAGALALVQPSYFESFSMVLTEAWSQRRPAVVQRHCDVLAGQAARSGGAIPYGGFGEFEAAVQVLLDDPGLADRLGAAGRRYVERRYDWPAVLERYEAFLASVAGRRTGRAGSLTAR
ncbi:MAG TPA: glycosyltransferase family 4 protein [Acidimicrobiales bacterium]|nr:glycosyltransferase family 4 protein [Acidimicrobiales bacterium]